MQYRSQAGQDRFVHAIARDTPGFFLDVGCSDPVDISNTHALEQAGWRGLLIDIAPELAPRIAAQRVSPFLCADATTIDWAAAIRDYALPVLPRSIDYLSFDLDGAGAVAFDRMPWMTLRFRILTVEHDAYRFGDGPRQAMRATLRRFGYDLVCPDVRNTGAEFEDWWVDPGAVNMTIVDRLRTTRATDWAEIVHP